MSAPVYELLKRPDELFVVEHAHLQPRFVEDSVRIALRDVLERLPDLADGDFVLSRQLNLETIHDHDVVAERHGTVGELRGELATGAPAARQTTLAEWLTGRRRLSTRRRRRPTGASAFGLGFFAKTAVAPSLDRHRERCSSAGAAARATPAREAPSRRATARGRRAGTTGPAAGSASDRAHSTRR